MRALSGLSETGLRTAGKNGAAGGTGATACRTAGATGAVVAGQAFGDATMTAAALAVADAPLALIAFAWWQGRQADDASARLERLAASVMLAAASAALWNGLAGAELLWQRWPVHACLAVMAAALPHARSDAAIELPMPTLLSRAAAYTGGFALAAVSSGWSFGQNALSAW